MAKTEKAIVKPVLETHQWYAEAIKAGGKPPKTWCFDCKKPLPRKVPAPHYAVLKVGKVSICYPICRECVTRDCATVGVKR